MEQFKVKRFYATAGDMVQTYTVSQWTDAEATIIEYRNSDYKLNNVAVNFKLKGKDIKLKTAVLFLEFRNIDGILTDKKLIGRGLIFNNDNKSFEPKEKFQVSENSKDSWCRVTLEVNGEEVSIEENNITEFEDTPPKS